MKLQVCDDIEELSLYAAGWMIEYINDVLSKRDRFTIALSGGNTPKKLFKLLSVPAYSKQIDWKSLHVFWGDERVVPFSDDRNNAKMAFDELLSKVDVPADQIHIMQTSIDPQDAAEKYEQVLHDYFDKQLYTFDLVMLGLGDNAHTLSLFPNHDDIIFEKNKWVKAFRLEEQDISRITLTAPVVNGAGRVAYLISGADKAVAMKNVISGKHDPSLYPAQVIQPLNGELYWLTDKAAASGIQHVTR
ncbi:MAG: 6-phosphogluconolactonase [Chitinophagaceae bacterium]